MPHLALTHKKTENIMKNILVVDDEIAVRNIVESILLSSGYRCQTACDPAEARKLLARQTFDLVISDINMPGESGLDFLKYVKTDFPETATIIITVMDSNEAAKEALAVGASGYIIKPFMQSELLFCVKHTLRRNELENANQAYQTLVQKVITSQITEAPVTETPQDKRAIKVEQLTAQALQSEKMAVIGQLAAGVAHEINTPIGFIGSNLSTLQEYCGELTRLIEQYRQLANEIKSHPKQASRSGAVWGNTETESEPKSESEPEPATRIESISGLEKEMDIDFMLSDISKLVQESLDGAERINAIVADLKDFVHPGKHEPEAVDLNQCIESTLNVVRNELKYKADVIKEFGELPEIQCVRNQIHQVIMNLLVNAAQAIEEKGEIRIHTENSDGWAEITISDNGMGIANEDLEQIFKPFFTTKEIGKGTGLGLHLSDKIIREHGGTINVYSRPGAGTSFTIRIPKQSVAGERHAGST
jgi:two-component system NtrC family sensor kinase